MYETRRSLSLLEYRRELIGLLGFVFTLFIGISVYSYNPHDPSWFFMANQPLLPSNMCGMVGAYLAAMLFFFLGSATYLLMPLLTLMTVALMKGIDIAEEWERIVAAFVLMVCVAALCALHGVQLMHHTLAGGYIGYVISSYLFSLVDYVGSLVILYAVMLSSLIVIFRFSFIYLIQWFAHGVVQLYALIVHYQVIGRLYAGIKMAVYAIFYPFIMLSRGIAYILDLYRIQEVSFLADDSPIYAGEPLPVAQVHESKTPTSESLVKNMVTSPLQFTAKIVPQKTVATPVELQEEQAIVKQEHVAAPIKEPVVSAPKIIARTFEPPVKKNYGLPSKDIFIGIKEKREDELYRKDLELRAKTLEEKLERFGVFGQVVSIKNGPVVTLFEYQPGIDTKISKILALEDDLALALQAHSIRILAPIPGRSVVGFEVANKDRKDVLFSQIVQSPEYADFGGSLPLILGKDTVGNDMVADLAKMPHLLIAGSTGSGKSVALNTMLISLLCKCTPHELRLILIDPKRLEFAPYADVAHLLFPIVTDPRKSVPVLRWVVRQMELRYEKMAEYGARNIFDYNTMAAEQNDEYFPFIVVVIDELSDLMLTVGREIEDLITRITQMARAAGIHMIVATQRPSVDVITGLIKVNFPSRISFRVTSRIDSRTILDCGGADKLLGRGDMLFLDSTASILKRIHGAYVSDREIGMVVDHIKNQQDVAYLDLQQELSDQDGDGSIDHDDIYEQVIAFLAEVDEVSISLLQRKFRIGYNRSARIIELLEARGLIMPADGGKTRRVIRS